MVYSIFRVMVQMLIKSVFRFRVLGVENIPSSGGVIIASNHVSYWDPPVIGCGLPSNRRIHFMAKEELFRVPIFRWVITQLCAFPVRRGTADRNAIRNAIAILERGEACGIFPEGTRSKTGVLGPSQPGLAMIALKAGVPIVPAAIIGTNKVMRDGHLLPQFTVRFGKPIAAMPGRSDKENSEYINTKVMQEIAQLLEE